MSPLFSKGGGRASGLVYFPIPPARVGGFCGVGVLLVVNEFRLDSKRTRACRAGIFEKLKGSRGPLARARGGSGSGSGS